MSIILTSPHEMAEHLEKQLRAKRLSLNLSQQTLSKRSGVSYGVLKKFERTGRISLESLLKLASSLDCLDRFQDLFPIHIINQPVSLDALMQDSKIKLRKRGRK